MHQRAVDIAFALLLLCRRGKIALTTEEGSRVWVYANMHVWRCVRVKVDVRYATYTGIHVHSLCTKGSMHTCVP